MVTQRNGSSVYQGHFFQEEVFIKIAKNQAANDRYYEILEALKDFALTPKVLNKFEWDDSSVLVMSSIEGTQVDKIFKNCTRAQQISLTHHGSSTTVTQNPNPDTRYPRTGEIDLMKYADEDLSRIPTWGTRIVANSKDVTGLLFISGISKK